MRPGRRPGKTAKSACPEGQVRNRTTKVCRDRRRPGRRPGKTAKKPGVKTARIAVSLLAVGNNNNNNNNNNNYNNNGKSYEEKIVEWYTEQGKILIEIGYFTYLKFKHISGSKLEVSYIASEGEDSEVALEMLADPDDDGNYPIKMDGETWLVSGTLY
jgi:hypothetical protein